MRIESDGHSRGNPRLYQFVEHSPKTGKSPTVWAWPELMDYLKIAGQPVAGPWPPHQEPRPDPEEDRSGGRRRPRGRRPRRIAAGHTTYGSPTPRRQGEQLSALLEDACTRPGSATRHRARSTRRSACCTRRRRRQGPRRRPEPGPADEARFASPELIVDINNLPGLDYHRADPDGTLRIGALCRHVDLERSALLKGTQPTMAAAAPLIADPIVRNRGTLVGSLCHADPQGDWASVMLALGGLVVAQGPKGRRVSRSGLRHRPVPERPVPRRDRGRGRDPAPQGARAGGYLKLERRVGDFATVGVALAVERSGDTVTRAGIALTGVGGSTIGATAAADALVGQALTEDVIGRAADLAARRPSRGPTTAAAPSTSGTWCALRHAAAGPRGADGTLAKRGGGKGGLIHDCRI